MKLPITLFILFYTASCATMFNSPSQVRIRAHNNDNPRVIIRNAGSEQMVQLPASVPIESSHRSTIVELDDNCFEDQSHYIEKEVSLTYYANILNIHGFWIDWLLGTMWKYPEDVRLAVVAKPNCKNNNQEVAEETVVEEYETEPMSYSTKAGSIPIKIKSVDYDARKRYGTIIFGGPVIQHREIMVKKLGEICSSSNIRVKAKDGVRMDGSYVINREFADETGYGFEFECN